MTPTFCLTVHAGYRCRRSGPCCTSNWPIAVEHTCHTRLADAIRAGRLAPPRPHAQAPFTHAAGLPESAPVVLGRDAAGHCAFFDGEPSRGCAIHRQAGHAALPSACRHFPRVVVLDGRGRFVTLSHYCPTAASMLFGPIELGIVEAPAPFAGEDLEGLDARAALPPLLRPGILTDPAGYSAWERLAVGTFARDDLSPEQALQTLSRATERIRTWRPGGRSLAELVEEVGRSGGAGGQEAAGTGRGREIGAPGDQSTAAGRGDVTTLFEAAVSCIPDGVARPGPHAAFASDWRRWVAGPFAGFARPVRFYLAAKVFGSWLAYDGQGLRTVLAGAAVALSCVKMEAARRCSAAGRPLDADLLREAFRAADLTVEHLVARDRLARRLRVVEEDVAARSRPHRQRSG